MFKRKLLRICSTNHWPRVEKAESFHRFGNSYLCGAVQHINVPSMFRVITYHAFACYLSRAQLCLPQIGLMYGWLYQVSTSRFFGMSSSSAFVFGHVLTVCEPLNFSKIRIL